MVAVVKSVNRFKNFLEFGDQLVVLFHSFTPVAVPLGYIPAVPLTPNRWRHPASIPLCASLLPLLPIPTSKYTLLKLTLGYPRPLGFRILLGITANILVEVVSLLWRPQWASLADGGDRCCCGEQTAHWR